jgi:hypothetical protein
MVFVYLIAKQGSDLDGQDRLIEADTEEVAAEQVASLETFYGWKLTLVGTKVGTAFTPSIPYDALPFWAQAWVDEQAPKPLARRERKPRVAKAKKPRATREDGIDFDFERAMDRAIAEDRKAARGGR